MKLSFQDVAFSVLQDPLLVSQVSDAILENALTAALVDLNIVGKDTDFSNDSVWKESYFLGLSKYKALLLRLMPAHKFEIENIAFDGRILPEDSPERGLFNLFEKCADFLSVATKNPKIFDSVFRGFIAGGSVGFKQVHNHPRLHLRLNTGPYTPDISKNYESEFYKYVDDVKRLSALGDDNASDEHQYKDVDETLALDLFDMLLATRNGVPILSLADEPNDYVSLENIKHHIGRASDVSYRRFERVFVSLFSEYAYEAMKIVKDSTTDACDMSRLGLQQGDIRTLFNAMSYMPHNMAYLGSDTSSYLRYIIYTKNLHKLISRDCGQTDEQAALVDAMVDRYLTPRHIKSGQFKRRCELLIDLEHFFFTDYVLMPAGRFKTIPEVGCSNKNGFKELFIRAPETKRLNAWWEYTAYRAAEYDMPVPQVSFKDDLDEGSDDTQGYKTFGKYVSPKDLKTPCGSIELNAHAPLSVEVIEHELFHAFVDFTLRRCIARVHGAWPTDVRARYPMLSKDDPRVKVLLSLGGKSHRHQLGFGQIYNPKDENDVGIDPRALYESQPEELLACRAGKIMRYYAHILYNKVHNKTPTPL